MIVADYGYKDLVKLLLDNNAKVNIKNKDRKKAIHYAKDSEIKKLIKSYK